MAGAKRIELVGLAILERYWILEHPSWRIEDVHNDPRYFPQGIDLIVHRDQTGLGIGVDVKVDTYIGSNPERKVRGLCNPDSGVLLLETLSQLQYDRREKDVPGWFYTSKAEEIHYYYLALLNEPGDLNPHFNEIRRCINDGESTEAAEEALLRDLKVDRDLLLTYKLKDARDWFEDSPTWAFRGWSGATNPTYVTVSVRVDRNAFCGDGPGKIVGPVFEKVRDSLR